MVTYEQIKAVNSKIRTIELEHKDKKTGKTKKNSYAPVHARVDAFRSLYPQGFITTEIVSMDSKLVVMKSSCGYYENGQAIIIGTGLAYEKEDGAGGLNRNSMIENCESSAVGRALGMAGLGIETAMASADEMNNAFAEQDAYEDDIDPERRTAMINEINEMMHDFSADEKRTIFSMARDEAGIDPKEDGTPKTYGIMRVSELERVKVCVSDVIGRMK